MNCPLDLYVIWGRIGEDKRGIVYKRDNIAGKRYTQSMNKTGNAAFLSIILR